MYHQKSETIWVDSLRNSSSSNEVFQGPVQKTDRFLLLTPESTQYQTPAAGKLGGERDFNANANNQL